MKNIQGMLQKAQALQARMTELQAELQGRERIGSSGQGRVKVTMNGAQDVIAISMITRMVEEEMKKVSGGPGLPPGLF